VIHPLISIITPCLNRADFIGEAVESVLAQNYPNLEHIIMDGGSTDGTLDVLRAYPHLCVTSEPDQGMYDAINKGIQKAHGELIGFLNTDDLYAPGCFSAVQKTIAANPTLDAVVGDASVFCSTNPSHETDSVYPSITSQDFWYRILQGASIFNAWFFHHRAIDRIGFFDTTFRTAADREYLIRAALLGIRPASVNLPFYYYRQHSGSYTLTTLDSRSDYGLARIKHLTESIAVHERYYHHPQIPKEARRVWTSAHSELSYQYSATAFYHHKWNLAIRAFFRGWRYNTFFPVIFSILAARRLGQAFSKPLQRHLG
jgi:glycosyltransferase involved in cell wall biosynthesis